MLRQAPTIGTSISNWLNTWWNYNTKPWSYCKKKNQWLRRRCNKARRERQGSIQFYCGTSNNSTWEQMVFPRSCIRRTAYVYVKLHTEFSSSCGRVLSLVLQNRISTEHEKRVALCRWVHPGYETKSHTSKIINLKKIREKQTTQIHIIAAVMTGNGWT